jgi:predicted phosphoribosyltransferase
MDKYMMFDEKNKLFEDRKQAGIKLAERLKKYRSAERLIVLALPRGGVPVAYEVAKSLSAPLDVFITRKLRFPDNPELALGALAENGEVFLNGDLTDYYSEEYLEKEKAYQKKEIKRRQILYRGGMELPSLTGKTVILIDDGVATGATMIATLRALKASQVKELIVAVPVAPYETIEKLSHLADKLIMIYTPSPFIAVGVHYTDFGQVSDDQVKEYLERAKTMDEFHKEARA